MRHRTLGILAGLAFMGLAGCAKHAPAQAAMSAVPASPPYRVTATVKQVMQALTIPSSNVIFNVASTAPESDDEWVAVERAAFQLAESGNLLMMDGRAIDHGEWMKRSRAMVDAAAASLTAVHAKDAEKMSVAGDAIYQTCDDCHMKYMKK